MGQSRFRIVFILLVLILLVASLLFGILTYWLGAGGVPAPTPDYGDAGPHTRDGPDNKELGHEFLQVGLLVKDSRVGPFVTATKGLLLEGRA